MRQRIIIVGGLAAGPSAAAKAKRVNPSAEVILFEKGEHISYGICEIPYYVGKLINHADDLIHHTPASLQTKKGVQVKTFSAAEEIVASKKLLIVRDLQRNKVEEYKYDKLILCTGSIPRKLGIPGEDGRNVFSVKSLEDGFAIRKYIDDEKPKRAVIIGGGYVGMEMAEALQLNGIQTSILHENELPMDGLEDSTRLAILEELKKHDVTFVPKIKVRQFNADGSGKVTEIVTSKGLFSTDLIILSLGVLPNVELARSARLRTGEYGGILTDSRQVTSVGSIYAAGDCCEVKNIVHNKLMYLPLATIASRQGRVAGENAAGGSAVFKGAIRALAVKIFELEVAHVGLTADEAKQAGFRLVKDEIIAPSKIKGFDRYSKIHIHAIVDKHSSRILGANLFGGDGVVSRANVLSIAIQQKMMVSELEHFDLIYSPPFAPLWDPVLVLSSQLQKRLGQS